MLLSIQKWNWKENISQLIEISKLLFPKNKKEWIIFAGLFLFYFCYSIFFALHTSVLDNLESPVDLYFSFDNGMYYVQGYSDLARHPLIKIFTFPILYIGNFLEFITGNYKVRTIFISSVCNLGISLSVLYSYRYLREIILLKGYIIYLITLMYTFMGMNLILSFTIESFTISLFFLTFATYYYSYCIAKDKNVTFLPNLFFAITLGGITMSNFAKGILLIIFTKEKLIVSLKKISLISVIFLLIIICLELKYHIFEEIFNAYNSYSTTFKKSSLLDNIITFFGIPTLLPNIGALPFFHKIKIDFMSYEIWWQYVFITLLFLSLVISILRNYKNKLIALICGLFSIDILVHFILRYGINELYLYAGHWIFIVPILLGWLYKSMDQKTKQFFIIILSILFSILCINNIIQINHFYKLAIILFPAIK